MLKFWQSFYTPTALKPLFVCYARSETLKPNLYVYPGDPLSQSAICAIGMTLVAR